MSMNRREFLSCLAAAATVPIAGAVVQAVQEPRGPNIDALMEARAKLDAQPVEFAGRFMWNGIEIVSPQPSQSASRVRLR